MTKEITKEKACSALTAVFPNKNAIADFIKDSADPKRLNAFVDFAARSGLIHSPTREAFYAFIEENRRPPFIPGPDAPTFEVLINNKKDYLNIRLSNRALVDRINGLLSNYDIPLPQLSRAMFTRLKKQMADTPHRRDALRSLAFWIGYERGELDGTWHYEALKDLCRHDESKPLYTPWGIRIAFSISSRGNVINQEIITWMKRSIKHTFRQRGNLSQAEDPPKIKNYDLTTFQVDLPNVDQSAIPSAYAGRLKEAISIAHHITILWIKSGFAIDNRFFTIGIAAGNFDEVNNQLQGILHAKLPENPVIRLTDYARQCVMISQIKIIMSHLPREIELPSGETVKVWWLTELSGMICWDLVPGILIENFSPKDVSTSSDLRSQLIAPGGVAPWQDDNAISCFLKFPHHPMLGFEIVRALICKNEISEALEILNALLRVTPHHLNSRITRMMLFKFLGVETLDYYFSDMMFKMAEKEAAYIIENFSHIGEDFYYEYALLKLARFSTGVKILRKNNVESITRMNCRLAVKDLIGLLDDVEVIIMEGIIVSSPTMERILYLFFALQALRCILFESIKPDGRLQPRLSGPAAKIQQHMFGVFLSRYQQKLAAGTSNLDYLQQITSVAVEYDDSMIALELFKPAQFFNRAVFFWDLLPVRNVAIISETLNMLKNAHRSATACARKEAYIYSTTNISGRIVPVEHFIAQIDAVIQEIEKRYQSASELKKMDPVAVIGRAEDDLALMTYHV